VLGDVVDTLLARRGVCTAGADLVDDALIIRSLIEEIWSWSGLVMLISASTSVS
jgi:hypothetical protein